MTHCLNRVIYIYTTTKKSRKTTATKKYVVKPKNMKREKKITK